MRNYDPDETMRKKCRKNIVEPGTGRINWAKAEHGWTQYFDDGIVTLNVDLFFRKRKKDEE